MNNQEHIDIPRKVRDKKIIPEESAQAGMEVLDALVTNIFKAMNDLIAENNQLKEEIKDLESRLTFAEYPGERVDAIGKNECRVTVNDRVGMETGQ